MYVTSSRTSCSVRCAQLMYATNVPTTYFRSAATFLSSSTGYVSSTRLKSSRLRRCRIVRRPFRKLSPSNDSASSGVVCADSARDFRLASLDFREFMPTFQVLGEITNSVRVGEKKSPFGARVPSSDDCPVVGLCVSRLALADRTGASADWECTRDKYWQSDDPLTAIVSVDRRTAKPGLKTHGNDWKHVEAKLKRGAHLVDGKSWLVSVDG